MVLDSIPCPNSLEIEKSQSKRVKVENRVDGELPLLPLLSKRFSHEQDNWSFFKALSQIQRRQELQKIMEMAPSPIESGEASTDNNTTAHAQNTGLGLRLPYAPSSSWWRWIKIRQATTRKVVNDCERPPVWSQKMSGERVACVFSCSAFWLLCMMDPSGIWKLLILNRLGRFVLLLSFGDLFMSPSAQLLSDIHFFKKCCHALMGQ